MNFEEFIKSLSAPKPPDNLPPLLQALWFDRKDDWEKSHDIAQEIRDARGSWIHAYLHRKEGDLANAGYWYRRAGKDMPGTSLQQEWETLARAFTD